MTHITKNLDSVNIIGIMPFSKLDGYFPGFFQRDEKGLANWKITARYPVNLIFPVILQEVYGILV